MYMQVNYTNLLLRRNEVATKCLSTKIAGLNEVFFLEIIETNNATEVSKSIFIMRKRCLNYTSFLYSKFIIRPHPTKLNLLSNHSY